MILVRDFQLFAEGAAGVGGLFLRGIDREAGAEFFVVSNVLWRIRVVVFAFLSQILLWKCQEGEAGGAGVARVFDHGAVLHRMRVQWLWLWRKELGWRGGIQVNQMGLFLHGSGLKEFVMTEGAISLSVGESVGRDAGGGVVLGEVLSGRRRRLRFHRPFAGNGFGWRGRRRGRQWRD